MTSRASVAAPAAIRGSWPSVTSSAPWVRAYSAAAARASSKSLPSWMTVAPNARIRSSFAGLAAPSAKTTAGRPRARAAKARPWPKLPVETPSSETYAEGIACRVPVPEALEMMVGRVDELVLVSEAQLHAAEAELTAATGITVEGAAAASWAALVADERRAGPALVILTGSNAR